MTWRLQRAGNLACQAGQHGASRQSIKYSIQHSQFMDLIPQEKTPSKIKKESSSLPTSPLHNLSWEKKAPCGWRPESGGKAAAETPLWMTYRFTTRPPRKSSKVQHDLFQPMLWYPRHSSQVVSARLVKICGFISLRVRSGCACVCVGGGGVKKTYGGV